MAVVEVYQKVRAGRQEVIDLFSQRCCASSRGRQPSLAYLLLLVQFGHEELNSVADMRYHSSSNRKEERKLSSSGWALATLRSRGW